MHQCCGKPGSGCAACRRQTSLFDERLACHGYGSMISDLLVDGQPNPAMRCVYAHIRGNWQNYMPFLVHCARHFPDVALFLLTTWVWDDGYDTEDWLGAEEILGRHDAVGRPPSQFIQMLRERLAPTTVAITGGAAMNPYLAGV